MGLLRNRSTLVCFCLCVWVCDIALATEKQPIGNVHEKCIVHPHMCHFIYPAFSFPPPSIGFHYPRIILCDLLITLLKMRGMAMISLIVDEHVNCESETTSWCVLFDSYWLLVMHHQDTWHTNITYVCFRHGWTIHFYAIAKIKLQSIYELQLDIQVSSW